jgi:hypothetical protein
MLQLDALAVALLPLALVAALVSALEPAAERWRALAGAALVGLALATPDLRLSAAAQLAAALLLGAGVWTRLGGGLGALATIWLGWSAGTWRWSDGLLGAAFGWPQVALWVVAAGLLLNLPAAGRQGAARPAPLLAISGLSSLFRMYQLGPIGWWWAWLGSALGLLVAALALRSLLGPLPAIDRARLAGVALWAGALLSLLLASEAGLAAAWLLAAAALYLDGVDEVAPLSGLGPALLGLWLAAAAALAGGAPLAGVGLVGLAVLYPALLGQLPARSGTHVWVARWAAVGGGVALSLAAPLGLWLVMRPLWRLLGAGLTPFGGLVIEPWIGLSVRNAGSQTVAALPLVALAGLALFGGAVGYVLLRLLLREATPAPPVASSLSDATLWRLVWRNLPVAARPRPGEGTPDEL